MCHVGGCGGIPLARAAQPPGGGKGRLTGFRTHLGTGHRRIGKKGLQQLPSGDVADLTRRLVQLCHSQGNLLCDAGERYLDSYYDPQWLARRFGDLTPYEQRLERFAAGGAFGDD